MPYEELQHTLYHPESSLIVIGGDDIKSDSTCGMTDFDSELFSPLLIRHSDPI